MSTDNALPPAEQATVSEVDTLKTNGLAPEPQEAEKPAEETAEKAEEERPAKTPEQREIERLRRKIDKTVRQREELRAQLQQGLTQKPIERDNQDTASDSEALTLSRAELKKLVEEQAKALAPQLSKQAAAIEHRRTVVEKLASTWGQERFDALASDLEDAFGGLQANGQPRPAVEAIFESEDPKALIEYLADPDHSAEAERLASLDPLRAGIEIARLEKKIASKTKPEPSKAATPIEPVRGRGTATNGAPNPADTKAWIRWANEQEAKARR